MSRTISMKIGSQDLNFENSLVRIVANRSCPEIKLAGLDVGPFEEGNEYEVYHWVALELAKSGVAHFRQEELDATRLNKIQWTERIQTPGQISGLPDDFYPKLRRCLANIKGEMAKEPEKMREYERIKHLTQDIINSRLKKIVSMASAPDQTDNTLRNLTEEEKYLYEQLHKLVSLWKAQILEYKKEPE